MRWLADLFNERGRLRQEQGHLTRAERWYRLAARLSPSWGVPWFNLGLMAKFDHRWQDAFELTLRATELDPDNAPAWWNLGIAATAIGDWMTARQAWSRYGIELPPGAGPIEMPLGLVPIRVNPQAAAEVVWSQRIDPARAILRNVPLPRSQRAFGDLVLHDGEPRGTRVLRGQEVPVFDELELLTPSGFSTYEVQVTVPDPGSIQELEALFQELGALEDWTSSIEMLCIHCSEGRPHDHHEPALLEWGPERTLGIAAREEIVVREILGRWQSAGSDRTVRQVTCVFLR